MKKIFTSLFATVAVFCASAAVPTYTVNPESGSTIENRAEFKVAFTFSEAVKADSAQLVGGARFNSQMVTVATTKKAANIIEVTVPSDAWGTASEGEYLLEVVLPEVYDSKGVLIQESDTDEETSETFYYPFTPRANYISPDNTPASYLRYEPSSNEVSAWEAYNEGWGSVDFVFSGIVQLTNEDRTARVIYTTTDDERITTDVTADEVWADWNMWTGEYYVNVMLPYVSELTEANLESIRVTLYGIESNGSVLSTEVANYYKSNSKKIAPKGNSTSGIKVINENECFNIYDLQGNIVLKDATNSNISTLKAGCYIANGKKIIIK